MFARWLAAVLCAAGLYVGFLVAPTDAQQGEGYRIIPRYKSDVAAGPVGLPVTGSPVFSEHIFKEFEGLFGGMWAVEPDPGNPRYIRTVRGLGYIFRPEGD